MKKIIAFILAVICGFAVWFIPAGLLLMLFDTNKNSPLHTLIIGFNAGLLIWIVKSFYKFFLKKFDNIVKKYNHKLNDNTKNSQNFTYENIDMSHFSKYKPNSKNSNHKEQKSSQNSQNHIDNILQSKRDK